jgi:uncharacterized membrane protein (DUF485 family)
MMESGARNIRSVVKFFRQATAFDRQRTLFIAGVVLMVISFLVYPAYPIIIVFLPASNTVKISVIVTAWFLSWGVFSAGIFLAGVEGYEWLKKLRRRRAGGAKS